MTLKERVIRSGLITAQEIAEVLTISTAHARKLAAEVRSSDDNQPTVQGRSGVAYQALIDALYARRTNDSFAQAQKLEKALGLRKRTRLQVVQVEPEEASNNHVSEEVEA